MWQDNVDVKNFNRTFNEANTYCSDLTLGGYSDWKLPNIDILFTYINHSQIRPHYSIFQNQPASYMWSSTKSPNSSKIWTLEEVSEILLDDTTLNDFNYVRCIRNDKVIKQVYVRDNTKEVVLDTTSNLVWQDNADAKDITKDWHEALSYCNDLSLSGYNNWRLPNINELFSLVDHNNYKPAISKEFKNVYNSGNEIYWSSTTSSDGSAWIEGIEFVHGDHTWRTPRTHQKHLRCVHDIE